MALKWLKKELNAMMQDPPAFCYAEPIDNDLFHWTAIIMGPPQSPFSGTALFLDILFSQDHPFKPPKVHFKFPVFHPNVNEHGNICAEILTSYWSPAISLSILLRQIIDILAEPLHGNGPLNVPAWKMYQTDRNNYNIFARDFCFNYFSNPEYQHLYIKLCFWQFGNLRKKLMTFIYEKDISIQDLTYPNDKLDKLLELIEKKAFSFLPLKVLQSYKKSKNLYSLIKSAENDDVECWVIELMKSDDIEFIENNIEFRICNNLEDKHLFELYLQYLRGNDTKKLLQMYSLYCRCFPEDKEMFENYKKAVEEFGFCLVPWKNPFFFFFFFEIFDENVYFLTRPALAASENLLQGKPSISCFFASNNVLSQNLPFKTPLMDYIFNASSPEILQKLQKTCKYFFIRLKTPVCYRLEVSFATSNLEETNETETIKTIEFMDSSAKITQELPSDSKFCNIRIGTILEVDKNNDLLTLSKCLPKIYQCDAKYICISNQNLTEEELKFLIRSKRVLELILKEVKIIGANGNGIMLEEVLELVPKIQRLRLDDIRCNPQTSQIISYLSFENAIQYFHLENLVDGFLEPHCFADFITKNATAKTSVTVRFSPDVENEYKENFRNIVQTCVKEKWPHGEAIILS